MSAPLVVAVVPGSPADHAGLRPGDAVRARQRARPARRHRVAAVVRRGRGRAWRSPATGSTSTSTCDKRAGEPLGAEVSSALFDRVRTCDNHCEFCFIYQLPKGLRRSLYLKDDDYRLSFLYGNFTTLTRFTESDLERVVTERLSPLHVSIHATDPELRARMLRNPRGATSLRWLRALLDHGIEVRGQLVVCPGVNDGRALDDTLAGILDEYPELALGGRRAARASPASTRSRRCACTRRPRRRAVVDAVEDWQDVYRAALGRRLVHAADEYYLHGRPAVPGRRGATRGSRCTRTASAWPARSSSSSAVRVADTTGRPARASSPPSTPAVRPADVLPPNPAAYTGLRVAAPTSPVALRPRRRRADRRPDRRARRTRHRAADRRRSVATTCA